jgi:hypothetical protein
MLWLAGIGLALVLAVSLALVLKGLGGLSRGKWHGAWAVLSGLGAFGVYILALGLLAFLLGSVSSEVESDPSQKARILAENISDLMNISIWGVPLGLLFGGVAVFETLAKSTKLPNSCLNSTGFPTGELGARCHVPFGHGNGGCLLLLLPWICLARELNTER